MWPKQFINNIVYYYKCLECFEVELSPKVIAINECELFIGSIVIDTGQLVGFTPPLVACHDSYGCTNIYFCQSGNPQTILKMF